MTKRKKKRPGAKPKAERSKKQQPPQPLTSTGILLAAGFGEPDPLFQPPKEAPQAPPVPPTPQPEKPAEPPKAAASSTATSQGEGKPAQPAVAPSPLDKLSPKTREKIISMGPKAVHLYESQLAQLSKEQIKALQADNLRAMEQDRAERKLFYLYPDTGPLRRELYPKHMRFFAGGGVHAVGPECPPNCAGQPHFEKSFIAGNRVGKTLAVCFELTCHMLGWYPPWWSGRRFPGAISAWAAGEDVKAVRESLQTTLLGAPDSPGTGTIPKRYLAGTTPRSGVPEAVDTITVRHSGGKVSRLLLKSYDQGRESFQAAKIDIMLFDEEPPEDIYSEGLTRTMSTVPGQPNGLVLCSFTPLKGRSKVYMGYLGGAPKGD